MRGSPDPCAQFLGECRVYLETLTALGQITLGEWP
jgi:hypothetical protein